jgi:hypothetical protein
VVVVSKILRTRGTIAGSKIYALLVMKLGKLISLRAANLRHFWCRLYPLFDSANGGVLTTLEDTQKPSGDARKATS